MSHNLNPFFVFQWLLAPALALGLLAPGAMAQNPSASITDVGNLGVTTASGDNGDFPQAAVVYDSASGLFYGTASQGGANNEGDVFSFNPTTGAVTDVADFTAAPSSSTGLDTGGNGASPKAALVYDSASGLFYGTAEYGGANAAGDVFVFNPTTNAITDVADFTSPFNQSTRLFTSGGNGAEPLTALVYDSTSGLFYGTASGGGANGAGDVFSFNPQTNALADAADFTSPFNQSTQQYTSGGNGAEPAAALVYDSANGLFYGTAERGGATGNGDVFAFSPATGAVTDVGDFTTVYNSSTGQFVGGNGAYPKAALAYDAANGLFYGTASDGGANSLGDVFSFNPAANAIVDVGDFGVTNGSQTTSVNGGDPDAALVYDSASGLFYGTASIGGANGVGDVFAFNPAANTLTDVGDFTSGSSANGSDGVDPAAPLAYDSVDGLFYGTASQGGADFTGDVFAFNPGVSTGTGTGTGTGGGATTTPTLLTMFPGGLQMVCLDETYTNFAEALNYTGGPSVSPPPYDTYSGSAYNLTNSATEAAPSPGTGFWIDPSSALSVYDTGSAVGSATIALHQGWNIIGDPFSDPSGFPLADIQVNGVTGLANANAALLLYATLYTWGTGNTTAYTVINGLASGAVLSPFTGYWLYAFQGGETLTMTQAMG